MIQVKIIETQSSAALEIEVNSWLQKHLDYKVISTTFVYAPERYTPRPYKCMITYTG